MKNNKMKINRKSLNKEVIELVFEWFEGKIFCEI
jgi:hypothetical protein